MMLAERLLQRWREADPWLSMAAATVVLTVASQPEDFRDGGLTFIAAGTIILFSGVFGVPIVCDILVSLIRRDVRDMVARDDADELVDFVRVSRVVIVLLVVLLWGWSPSSLGSDDPGDRSSSPAQVELVNDGPVTIILDA